MSTQYGFTTKTSPLITCWSPKGGSGTSVTAAVLALALARQTDTVLIDSAGDQAAIFGVPRSEVGFAAWAEGGVSVAPGSLARLAVPVTDNLRLVDTGVPATYSEPIDAARIRDAFPGSVVVVDLGCVTSKGDGRANVAATADKSLMVLRPCYLAAQRALAAHVKCDGIILMQEPGRVLRTKDIQGVLMTDIVAGVEIDPALARLVDAGRMTKRLPRSTRSLEKLALDFLQPEVRRAG